MLHIEIAVLVQYSRKCNIDGLVQYSRKCIFGTALTTFSFFNYSLVNYFRQVKSISCDKFHLSIYIIISLFTFYMKNSNGGHKTCKMTEMHLRLYCTNPDRSHLRLYCTNPARSGSGVKHWSGHRCKTLVILIQRVWFTYYVI